MDVIVTCIYCNKTYKVRTSIDAFNNWQYKGMNIQDAMPKLSAEERELLLSRICPTCWKTIFPPEDEEKSLADETKKGG